MAKVRYRGKLALLTRTDEEEVQASKVKDVLDYIKKNYGQDAWKGAKKMLIVVDHKSITLLQNFNTPLTENSIVGFLPICGGG